MPERDRLCCVGEDHNLAWPEPVDTNVEYLVGCLDAAADQVRIGAEHVLAGLDHRGGAHFFGKDRIVLEPHDRHVFHIKADDACAVIHEAAKA